MAKPHLCGSPHALGRQLGELTVDSMDARLSDFDGIADITKNDR
ncbi:MAG TPA: hypothetical protein VM328_11070 [Fimbriimonadaceae bacterium]|nr:hypothetical protein [Fimbriimonadaceae bacterium]